MLPSLGGGVNEYDLRPDATRFNNLTYATDDTVNLLREELKARLLAAADAHCVARARNDAVKKHAAASAAGRVDDKSNNVKASGAAAADDDDDDHDDVGYAMRLLRKIVRKIILKSKRGTRI